MKKKIIIKIRGGLGNQLFMLSYVLKLMKYNNVKIYIDNSDYKQYKIRNFEIESYIKNIPNIEILPHDFSRFKMFKFNFFYNIYRLISYAYKKKNKEMKNKNIEKIFYYFGMDFSEHGSDENKKLKKNNYYVYGYFQNVNYVDDVNDAIESVVFNKQIVEEICENEITNNYRKKISKLNEPIAISIRCGDDYVNSGWPICTHNYYKKAIDYICEVKETKNKQLVFFSDNIDITKKEFQELYPDAIFIENMSPRESLYLMSLCQDYVISNSSFSWWGQKLSVNKEEKKVVAPEFWYKNNKKTIDTKLYESNLIIMNNNGNIINKCI